MNQLRRDLRAISADGAACNVMVGAGENYFGAFVLALSMNQLAAGLIATVPMVIGAVLQLVAPYAVARLGSYRLWVVMAAALQALTFIPLVAAAWTGRMPLAAVFGVASVYWALGLASGPAWNAWVDSLVPRRMRARYFARRSRLAQLGLCGGFVCGGLALQAGTLLGRTLATFGLLFLLAGACRMISAYCLGRQREPLRPSPPAGLGSLGDNWRALTRGRTGSILVYLLVAQLAVQVSGPYFTPYMLRQLHLSYFSYMVLICTALVAKIAILPVLGRLTELVGAERMLWFSAWAIVPVSGLWCLSQHYGYLLAIQVLSGFAWAGWELASLLLFFDSIPKNRRMGVLTLFNLANSLAFLLGSILGALVLRHWEASVTGYLALFLLSSLGRVLALGLLIRIPAHAPAAPPVVLLPHPAVVLADPAATEPQHAVAG